MVLHVVHGRLYFTIAGGGLEISDVYIPGIYFIPRPATMVTFVVDADVHVV